MRTQGRFSLFQGFDLRKLGCYCQERTWSSSLAAKVESVFSFARSCNSFSASNTNPDRAEKSPNARCELVWRFIIIKVLRSRSPNTLNFLSGSDDAGTVSSPFSVIALTTQV